MPLRREEVPRHDAGVEKVRSFALETKRHGSFAVAFFYAGFKGIRTIKRAPPSGAGASS